MTDFERLTKILSDAGFEYTVTGEYENVTVSIEVPAPEFELPEELKPFAWDDVDRAIWKGNASKRTYAGADFELALRDYASHLLYTDPEMVALKETLSRVTTKEELDEYDKKRQAIWERVNKNPKLTAWEKELEGML